MCSAAARRLGGLSFPHAYATYNEDTPHLFKNISRRVYWYTVTPETTLLHAPCVETRETQLRAPETKWQTAQFNSSKLPDLAQNRRLPKTPVRLQCQR